MDVDHLAAEDSDEGGLTGECRQVVLCLQLQEVYVQCCSCALRRCAEGMSCAAGSLTKTKLLQGIGCPEVVPPFHMAAGAEQEEEDLIEHSDPSGHPGPIQSGEGAHHLHFCLTDANALVKARPAGNLQNQNARLLANAGVSKFMPKYSRSHSGTSGHNCTAGPRGQSVARHWRIRTDFQRCIWSAMTSVCMCPAEEGDQISALPLGGQSQPGWQSTGPSEERHVMQPAQASHRRAGSRR